MLLLLSVNIYLWECCTNCPMLSFFGATPPKSEQRVKASFLFCLFKKNEMHPNSLPTCSPGWEEGTFPGILFSVHLKAEQCGFVELCLFCDCILLLKWAGDRICSAGLQPLSAPSLPKACSLFASLPDRLVAPFHVCLSHNTCYLIFFSFLSLSFKSILFRPALRHCSWTL